MQQVGLKFLRSFAKSSTKPRMLQLYTKN